MNTLTTTRQIEDIQNDFETETQLLKIDLWAFGIVRSHLNNQMDAVCDRVKKVAS
jgi:hypothetical protein